MFGPCFVIQYIVSVYFYNHLYILRDFRNAPFYIHCLFNMVNLRIFSLSFLSSCTMDHDLP